MKRIWGIILKLLLGPDRDPFPEGNIGHAYQVSCLDVSTIMWSSRHFFSERCRLMSCLSLFVTVQVAYVMLRSGGLLRPQGDTGGVMGPAAPCTRPGMRQSERQGHGDAAACVLPPPSSSPRQTASPGRSASQSCLYATTHPGGSHARPYYSWAQRLPRAQRSTGRHRPCAPPDRPLRSWPRHRSGPL